MVVAMLDYLKILVLMVAEGVVVVLAVALWMLKCSLLSEKRLLVAGNFQYRDYLEVAEAEAARNYYSNLVMLAVPAVVAVAV